MDPIIFIFIGFGLLFFASFAFAIFKVINAAKSGNGSSAWKSDDGETSRLCKTLDGEQLYKLAQGLVREDGHKTDYTKWEKYTLAAAEKGHAAAQREIGAYYKYDQNKLAIDWLQRAADAGDGEAVVILGEIYEYGLNRGFPKIEKNIDRAVEIYRAYAEKGCVSAQRSLAHCLFYDLDDRDGAIEWYLKAADAGDLKAMQEVSQLYLFGGEEQKAYDILLKAADKGYAESECSLGNYFSDLKEPDYNQAFGWYIKAAEHGDTFAMCRSGEMYLAGEGVLKDVLKAFEWFKKAMENGSVYGEYLLGKCYMNGDGVEQDIEKGIKHYKEAAQYDSDAQYALAECYLEGNGVKKDAKKAEELLLKSSEDSIDGKAAYKLGELYYAGEVVKKDEQAAHDFWLKAAKYGDKDAAESLKIYFGESVDDD